MHRHMYLYIYLEKKTIERLTLHFHFSGYYISQKKVNFRNIYFRKCVLRFKSIYSPVYS